MKICRFCQHQQESGDSCEQCGAPFAADKLDFSDSGSSEPDVTGENATWTSETPTETSEAQTGSTGPEVAGTVMPGIFADGSSESAAPATNAETHENPSDEAKAKTSEKQKKKNIEFSGNENLRDENGRKILYSAKAAGESVYLGNKGLALVQSSQVNPSEIPEGVEPYDSKKYNGTYMLSKFALVLNSACLVCCCVSNLISFILGLCAYTKMNKVIKGKDKNPEQSAKTAKTLAITSFVLLVIWGMILAYIIFFTDLIDEL